MNTATLGAFLESGVERHTFHKVVEQNLRCRVRAAPTIYVNSFDLVPLFYQFTVRTRTRLQG